MKVVELIKKLNEIGYDENTELTFSCVNGYTGQYYKLEVDDGEGEYPLGVTYGEELTGKPYKNDVIDICLDVDGCKKYVESVMNILSREIVDDLSRLMCKYDKE